MQQVLIQLLNIITAILNWLLKQSVAIVIPSIAFGITLGAILWFAFCSLPDTVKYVDGGYQRLGHQHSEAVQKLIESHERERDKLLETIKMQIDQNRRLTKVYDSNTNRIPQQKKSKDNQ